MKKLIYYLVTKCEFAIFGYKIELGPIILACWLASGPDLFGQNLTRPSMIHITIITNITYKIQEEHNQIGCGKFDQAYVIWLAITGHNQSTFESDLACLLGTCWSKLCALLVNKNIYKNIFKKPEQSGLSIFHILESGPTSAGLPIFHILKSGFTSVLQTSVLQFKN